MSIFLFLFGKVKKAWARARQGLKSSGVVWISILWSGFSVIWLCGRERVFWICPSRQIISVYNFLRNGYFGLFLSFFLEIAGGLVIFLWPYDAVVFMAKYLGAPPLHKYRYRDTSTEYRVICFGWPSTWLREILCTYQDRCLFVLFPLDVATL